MPPTSVGGIFRVGRGVAAGALRLGLFRGGFATSQAIPDHNLDPQKKHFMCISMKNVHPALVNDKNNNIEK